MWHLKKIFNQKINAEMWLFVLIVFVGAVLRFVNLGQKSYWLDEAAIFEESKLPLPTIFHDVRFGGVLKMLSEPFICFVVSHLFYALTNNSSEFFLRFPSCIFGIGSIILIYFLSKVLFKNKKIALISSLFVAISQLQIWESQQLRPYSMTMFFSLLLLLSFFKFLISHKNKDLAFFVFASIMASLMHYPIILLVAINILFISMVVEKYVIDKNMDKIFVKKWILSQSVVFIFCLIEYVLFIKSRAGYWSEGFLSPWHFHNNNFFQNIYYFFPRTFPLFISYLPVHNYLFVLLLLLFFIGLMNLWLYGNENGKNFVILSILSFGITYVFACIGKYPYVFGKRTIFLSPFFYIIISYAFTFKNLFKSENIGKLVIGILFIPIIFSSFSFSKNYLISPLYPPTTGIPNSKFIINQFKLKYEKGDNVFITPGGIFDFQYYFDCKEVQCFFAKEGGDLEKEIELFLSQNGRKWIYLVHLTSDRRNEILRSIEENIGIDYVITDQNFSAILAKCHDK